MFCVRSFSLSLIWNVTKLSSFVPNKGLQQGDPLFPYHFVLGMKKLSYLIFNKVAGKTRKSVHLSRGGPNISHLFIVDDILFFTKAKNSQISLISNVLFDFCKASGLKVNFEKSRIICSKYVCRARKNIFSQLSLIHFVSDLGKYLGFPLI